MSKSFDDEFSTLAGIELIFSFQAFDTILLPNPASFFSNSVAITVITISSCIFSSITAPKIMFASGSTLLCTNSAAVFTSCNPKSVPPDMYIITHLDPSIDLSSN